MSDINGSYKGYMINAMTEQDVKDLIDSCEEGWGVVQSLEIKNSDLKAENMDLRDQLNNPQF